MTKPSKPQTTAKKSVQSRATRPLRPATYSKQAHVEARIEHVADLMRSLKFVRGVTYKQLAKDWNLTEQRVREISMEASRRVRLELTDVEGVQLDVCAALSSAMRTAHTAGNLKAVAAIARAWADITGASARTNVRVQVANDQGLPADLVEQETVVQAYLARLKEPK